MPGHSLPPTDAIADFLNDVSLFQHVRPEYKQQIAQRLELCSFQRDQVIFQAGDPGDALYIIQNGSVGVFLVEPLLGLSFELARLKAGQVFGEMAVLTDEVRSATCRAMEPTLCFRLPQTAFGRILEKIPDVAIAVAKVLADRVRELNSERGAAVIDLSQVPFDAEIYRMVPMNILEQHRMIPLNIREGVLTVACADARNLAGLDEIRRIIRGVEIKTLAVKEDDYKQFFERNIQPMARGPAKAHVNKVANVRWLGDDQREAPADVARGDEVKVLVDRIVAEAIEREASDIHVEPEREGLMVRYRVSGRLVKRSGPPIARALHRAVASRFKILAELDISEKRLPQDGRMSCEAAGRSFDLRVSTLPTQDGEKIVLRVLDSANAMQPIERLILAEKVCQVVNQMIMRPHGVVYVCGPTGSGKTTTLYSALGIRRREDTNITTVEDPVEYHIPGVSQVNVRSEVGLTFARVLRAVLRQDPNVILVGETRDAETGRIVLEAGLTGHLVLTSLHTNDALGAIQRLSEMDLEPFAIASSLVGVISQRLVRRLCPACAHETPLSQNVFDQLVMAEIIPPDFKGRVRRAPGCPTCGNTGYRGRVGSYEILVADDNLRQQITAGASPYELRATALKGAFVPMNRYSNYLLTCGITGPEELLAIHTGAAS